MTYACYVFYFQKRGEKLHEKLREKPHEKLREKPREKEIYCVLTFPAHSHDLTVPWTTEILRGDWAPL